MDKKENKNVAEFMAFSLNRQENTPVFVENRKDAHIPWGSDNNYGEYLVGLMNSSSKHNSLLTKKVNMTVGAGFLENELLTEFISNIQGTEDLNDIVYKMGWDLYLYGGFSLAVTWSKDKTKIARIKFMPFDKVRVAKEDEENKAMMKKIEKGKSFYFYSGDWKQTRQEKFEPVLMQSFNGVYDGEATELIHFCEYRSGVDHYTHPSYISTIDWIELDREIANFHLNSVHNGFTPSMIISFKNGTPSEEERKAIKKNLQKQYGGTDNASSVFVTFTDGAENAPEFIPVNLNASDERFIQLEEQIQQNIIVGHGASPIVAGVAVNGKLGSSDEVIESEQVFQRNVIDKRQKSIERVFNNILATNNIEASIELDGIKSFDEPQTQVEDGNE